MTPAGSGRSAVKVSNKKHIRRKQLFELHITYNFTAKKIIINNFKLDFSSWHFWDFSEELSEPF